MAAGCQLRFSKVSRRDTSSRRCVKREMRRTHPSCPASTSSSTEESRGRASRSPADCGALCGDNMCAVGLHRHIRQAALGLLLVACLVVGQQPVAAAGAEDELIGVWKAKRWFGPLARGPIVIEKAASGWSVDFVGHTLAAQVD